MTKKCGYCGGYLPDTPFYFISRLQGTLNVWVCPNCRKRYTEFEPNEDKK